MSTTLHAKTYKFMDILILLTMILAAPFNISAVSMDEAVSPTLSTDKMDYAPGESAHVIGAGFAAGDYVLVANGPNGLEDWGSVTADESGGFETTSPALVTEGMYELSAYPAGGDSAAASISFTVTAPAPPTDEPVVEEPTPEPVQESIPESTQEPEVAEPTPDSGSESGSIPVPSIRSDKDDYFAGEWVTLAGENWQPGESVHIIVNDVIGDSWRLSTDVIAADNGLFVYQFQLPDWFVAQYRVYAYGPTSGAAIWEFTDSRNWVLTFAGSGTGTVKVTPSTGTVNAPVSCGGTGGNAASQTVSSTCLPNISTSDNVAIITFLATAGGSSTFAGWSGTSGLSSSSCTGTTNPCNAIIGSNSALTVTFNASTINSTLSLAPPSPASINYGSAGPVALSATLAKSSGGATISGATIAFTVGGSSVGTAVTDGSGVATLSYNPSALTINAHTVQASFAGGTVGGTLYSASTSGTQTLTVTKLNQSITFDPLADKMFGDVDFSVSASTSSGLAVSFNSQTPLKCTVSGSTVHIVAVGTCTIRASQTGDATYNPAPNADRSFNILQASSSVTVTCPASTQPYTGSAQTPCTASYLTSDGLSGSLTPTYADNVNVGTATASAAYPGDANHQGSNNSANFEIGKAASTVVISCPASVVYNASAQQPCTASVTGAGGLNEVLPVNYSNNTNAGTAIASASYDGDLNHDPDSDSTTFEIAKADATCTVNGYTGVYDTLAHGATGSCVGIGGEDAGTLNLGDSFTNVPGGTAYWTFTGNGNYEDESGDAAIVITKADATCTVNGYTGVYDTLAHGATGSCVGIGGEDAGTLNLGNPFTNVPGGTAYWTFTGNGNYEDESGNVAIVITKADAACTVNGYTGVYDTLAHGATGSCVGIGGEDAGTLDLGDPFTNVPGGTAYWTFTGNGNYEDESGDVAIVITKADAACTVTPYNVTYDGTAHTATGSCLGVVGETLSGLNLSGTTHTIAGDYPTDSWVFTDITGNYNNTSGTVHNIIAKALLTVTPDDWSRQYSDPNPAVFTFKYSGFVTGEDHTFLTTKPVCTTTRTVDSAPGNYDITCSSGVDENYNFDYKTGKLTVTKEDALAYYTGNTLFWGATSTSTSANVTLSATIKDITSVEPGSDPDGGDIRNAKVTFLSNGNPISGCTNLPVSLVSTGDLKVGTVNCTATFSIGSTGASLYNIGIQVNNYYTRYSSEDSTTITVSQPLTTNFITGGGYIILSNSAGQYAGGVGTRANYGFNIKYNKNRTNLQGNVNIIFRADGKVFQIKSNSLQSLGVSCSPGASGTPTKPCMANFVSKANLTDITDPNAPISLGGNLTLQMQMTDKGEPGSSDTISFTLFNGSKLLFSSNWNGTKTVEQTVGGGNLVVH